jgi:hypothetical protein
MNGNGPFEEGSWKAQRVCKNVQKRIWRGWMWSMKLTRPPEELREYWDDQSKGNGGSANPRRVREKSLGGFMRTFKRRNWDRCH